MKNVIWRWELDQVQSLSLVFMLMKMALAKSRIFGTTPQASACLAQELLHAAELHVLDAGAARELAFPQRELEVVVGLDHGQGALSEFAKFLLTRIVKREWKLELQLPCCQGVPCKV